MADTTSAQSLFPKDASRKIVMLTAYDFPLARLVDKAGVDIVLVGDSLANVVLGLDSTVEVGIDAMVYHAKAVVRGVERAYVVADMPFEAYQIPGSDAVRHARRLVAEAGCGAVKVEWFAHSPGFGAGEVTRALRAAGIEVMGHVGLTPQTARDFRVQGRDTASARAIIEQAKVFEAEGCFSVVLECVPEALAAEITRTLKIPTIGIGAGKFCDGQVLVLHDMLGLNDRKVPSFVKKYADTSALIIEAVRQYREEVQNGSFPDDAHTFH